VSDEAKIFTTKERAPVLLHFEAFRPEELMLYLGQPEKPLSLGVKKRTARAGKRNNLAFKSTTDALALGSANQYDQYRSSSWGNNMLSREE
jgi:hypothetical protein